MKITRKDLIDAVVNSISSHYDYSYMTITDGEAFVTNVYFDGWQMTSEDIYLYAEIVILHKKKMAIELAKRK